MYKRQLMLPPFVTFEKMIKENTVNVSYVLITGHLCCCKVNTCPGPEHIMTLNFLHTY